MKKQAYSEELEDLRSRLREAEETLEAIRSGAVDAIVVSGKAGEQVYTLQGADQSYRMLVESIQEGMVKMSPAGVILYSNKQFADMLDYPLEKIIGSAFTKLIAKDNWPFFEEALSNTATKVLRFPVVLNSCVGERIPAQITMGAAGGADDRTLTLVITNLSEQFRYQEIVAEEKLSRSIMENSPDGIAVCDPDGIVIRASKALDQFCQQSCLLKPFDKVLRIEIKGKNSQPQLFSVKNTLAGETLLDIEGQLYCHDRSTFDIRLNAISLQNEDQIVTGCLITITDVTSHKQAEEALQKQSERLLAANKEMESFSYSVSHDLRAPLRAIDGFSRILLRKVADKLNDDEKRRFEVIRDNTRKMGQLIDDLLNFSRLGRQSMSVADFNMQELVSQLWEELTTINPGRRMSLVIGALPIVCGDASLIRQVLANLLSNAVKFTRKKEEAIIEIGSETKNSEMVFFVRDNGVGFDMQYYKKLFGVFQRLHSPEEFEGTGAGLAIVQRIIHRHGGRVWAQGEVDKGACFYFSLPDRSA